MARPKSPTAKREKIELRVTFEQKELLRAAAVNKGLPTSTWILDLALRSANQTFDRARRRVAGHT